MSKEDMTNSTDRTCSPTHIQFYTDDKGWVELDPNAPISEQPINGTWFSVEPNDAGNGIRAMRIGTTTKLQAGQHQQQSFIISSGPQTGSEKPPVQAMIIKTDQPIETVPPPPNFGNSPNPLLNQSWPPAFMTPQRDPQQSWQGGTDSHNFTSTPALSASLLDLFLGHGQVTIIPLAPPLMLKIDELMRQSSSDQSNGSNNNSPTTACQMRGNPAGDNCSSSGFFYAPPTTTTPRWTGSVGCPSYCTPPGRSWTSQAPTCLSTLVYIKPMPPPPLQQLCTCHVPTLVYPQLLRPHCSPQCCYSSPLIGQPIRCDLRPCVVDVEDQPYDAQEVVELSDRSAQTDLSITSLKEREWLPHKDGQQDQLVYHAAVDHNAYHDIDALESGDERDSIKPLQGARKSSSSSESILTTFVKSASERIGAHYNQPTAG